MNILDTERLDKIISAQLNISRKDARTGIHRGQAVVNGDVIRNVGFRVDTQNDSIIFNGNELKYKKHIYIVMNKPAGVLSASSDKKRETVVDIIPEDLKRNGLFPVGRLDRDTTGLLIITDDGEFAHRVISPKKGIPKTYTASLDGTVTDKMCEKFKEGIVLADGTVCSPAELVPLGENCARITIYEGKYHQIKRMFGTVGLGVNSLHRNSIGDFVLPAEISEAESREMTEDEINCIIMEE